MFSGQTQLPGFTEKVSEEEIIVNLITFYDKAAVDTISLTPLPPHACYTLPSISSVSPRLRAHNWRTAC